MAAVRISLSHDHWSVSVLPDSVHRISDPLLSIYAVESTGFVIGRCQDDAAAMSAGVELQAQSLQAIWRPWHYVIVLQIVAHDPVP
jgi:hypothetical protein